MSGTGTPPADPGALPEFIASVARTVLAYVGGLLVARQVIDVGQSAGFISAGLFVITLAWSFYQKWQARQRYNAAVAAPAGKAVP